MIQARGYSRIAAGPGCRCSPLDRHGRRRAKANPTSSATRSPGRTSGAGSAASPCGAAPGDADGAGPDPHLRPGRAVPRRPARKGRYNPPTSRAWCAASATPARTGGRSSPDGGPRDRAGTSACWSASRTRTWVRRSGPTDKSKFIEAVRGDISEKSPEEAHPVNTPKWSRASSFRHGPGDVLGRVVRQGVRPFGAARHDGRRVPTTPSRGSRRRAPSRSMRRAHEDETAVIYDATLGNGTQSRRTPRAEYLLDAPKALRARTLIGARGARARHRTPAAATGAADSHADGRAGR